MVSCAEWQLIDQLLLHFKIKRHRPSVVMQWAFYIFVLYIFCAGSGWNAYLQACWKACSAQPRVHSALSDMRSVTFQQRPACQKTCSAQPRVHSALSDMRSVAFQQLPAPSKLIAKRQWQDSPLKKGKANRDVQKTGMSSTTASFWRVASSIWTPLCQMFQSYATSDWKFLFYYCSNSCCVFFSVFFSSVMYIF